MQLLARIDNSSLRFRVAVVTDDASSSVIDVDLDSDIVLRFDMLFRVFISLSISA
jgi:hypothetical protein